MGLRKAVIQGGSYLFIRQGLGLGLTVIYFIIVFRHVGPEVYGIFSLGTAVLAVAQQALSFGVGVYLVRNPYSKTELVDLGFSYIVLASLLGFLFSPFLAQLIILSSQLSASAFIHLLCIFTLLPVSLLGIIPQSLLERNLAYKEMAKVELTSQVLQLGITIPLALANKGIWALIAGIWSQQLTLLLGYWIYSRYQPKWRWSWSEVADMFTYGLGYNISFWIWQMRSPLALSLINRYLGTEAVGVVALTMRLVEYVSFPKSLIWRISLPALGRLQKDKKALLQAVEEGAFVQTLLTGILLLSSGFLMPWLVPKAFGNSWSEILRVFPFIALGTLANATFALHSSALYVLRLNKHVALFHLAHISILALSLFFWLPKLGLLGYGLAELTTLSSYIVIHYLLVRFVDRMSFILPMGWLISLGTALLYPWLGLIAFVPLAIWLFSPVSFTSWSRLSKSLFMLRRA